MALIDPLFEFGFDVLDKGIHVLEVQETGIAPPSEGKESGKRYWVRLVAVGGSQDGVSHIENFYEITKNDFSFRKMAGFLYKLGIIKTLGKVDTASFLTPQFEQKWLKGINGKRLGAKIRHRFDSDDKARLNPRSDIEQYMTYDEAMAIMGKAKKVTESPGPIPPNQPDMAPGEKAPWD